MLRWQTNRNVNVKVIDNGINSNHISTEVYLKGQKTVITKPILLVVSYKRRETR